MKKTLYFSLVLLLASTSLALAGDRGRGTSSAAAVSGSVAVSGAVSAASVTNEDRRQAPAVSAPGLAASSESCMGSSAAGASVAGFGASFGTTWKDEDCNRRHNARELRLEGQHKAASILLCMNADVAKARALAGSPCPSTEPPKVSELPIPGERHPACAPGSWASADWRQQNCR